MTFVVPVVKFNPSISSCVERLGLADLSTISSLARRRTKIENKCFALVAKTICFSEKQPFGTVTFELNTFIILEKKRLVHDRV